MPQMTPWDLAHEAKRLREEADRYEQNGQRMLADASAMRAAAERLAPAQTTVRGRRARRGTTRERILAQIDAHPGITARRISDATGMNRAHVATVLSNLKKAGVIVSTGSDHGYRKAAA